MTNELVVGENRYDPIFGQPSSLDKISFTGTPVDNTEQYYFGNSRVVSTWQVVDNFAYFRGAHTFKFGTNLRRVREEDIRGSVAGLNANEEVNFSTAINTVDPATFGLPADLNTAFDRPTFQSNINFMLGRVGQIDRGFVNQNGQWTKNNFQFDTRYPEYEFYAQDTWKVQAQPHRRSRPALRNPPVAQYAGQQHPGPQPAHRRRRRAQQHRAVGSRSSSSRTSWAISDPPWVSPGIRSRTGKTSIRANYRIAYDRINDFVIASTILPNLPGAAFAAINTDFGQNGGRLANLPALNPPTATPSSLTQPAAFSSASNTVVDPNLKTPRTHQWAFDIQRAGGSRHHHRHRLHRPPRLSPARRLQRQPGADLQQRLPRRLQHRQGAAAIPPLMDNLLKADTRLNAGETGSQMVRRLYASNLTLNSVGALAASLGHALAERRLGHSALHRPAVLLHPVPAVHQPERARLQRFLHLPRARSAVDAPPLPTASRSTSPTPGRSRWTPVPSIPRSPWSAPATRPPRPTRRSTSTTASSTTRPVDFDRRHVFQWNFVAELPFGKGKHFLNNAGTAGSGPRRLGSHRLRTPHQRPSLHGVLRLQHGQQRQPVHRQLHWLRPRRRHPVPRSGFRPDLVLRRRRARQVLRPRRRPVRQHRPQLLRRPALFRNRCLAAEAHSRDRAHQARVPRRRHQPDQHA